MKKCIIVAAVFSLLSFMFLAGCSNDKTKIELPDSVRGFQLDATVPPDGSREAVLSTQIIFHFNRTIDIDSVVSGVAGLVRENEETGVSEDVPVAVRSAGSNLILVPVKKLQPDSKYVATVTDRLRCDLQWKPEFTDGVKSITFFTRADRSLAGYAPVVQTVIPLPDDDVFEWTTFHVYFSEPVNPLTTEYGDEPYGNISLRKISKDGGRTAIPAQMFISGSQVVIDPESDLIPGESYELFVSSSLRDQNGERIGDEDVTYTYTIKSTNPRNTFFVNLCPTLGKHSSCAPVSDIAGMRLSDFTGDQINTMTMSSTMLGRTQVVISGKLSVELGSTQVNSNYVPVVIRKGQKLIGEPVDALLGGAIPSGLNTDNLVVTVLSDAYGFMESSERQQSLDGGPVMLWMMLDVGLNTLDEATNAQMGQTILGVQLVGSVTVEGEGILYMDVTGFSSLNILGEEMGVSISLGLEPLSDGTSPDADLKGPSLLSSSPAAGDKRVRLGEPIILNFDEPLDTISTPDLIRVETEDGEAVDGKMRINGSKLSFYPSQPFNPNSTYMVTIPESVMDIDANTTAIVKHVEFTTGASEATIVPPRISSTDPAFNSLNRLPAHLPVQVFFTQIMNPNSIVLGDSVLVLDHETNEDIPGTLKVDWTSAVFTPNEPFETSRIYRLVLTDDIENFVLVALDIDNDGVAGGSGGVHSIATTFQVSPADESVPMVFELSPLIDADCSGTVDGTERVADNNYFAINFLGLFPTPSYASGYLIAYINNRITVNDKPRLPITLRDGIQIYATGTQLELFTGRRAEPTLTETGRISVKADGLGSADVVENRERLPEMLVEMQTLFSVQNDVFDGLLQDGLFLQATGDLSFSEDGRMIALITGSTDITMTIPLLNWDIPLPVTLNLKASSKAP